MTTAVPRAAVPLALLLSKMGLACAIGALIALQTPVSWRIVGIDIAD